MADQNQLSANKTKRKHRVSQKDIARRAGVSQATVSRVFSDGDSVSEQKRERVLTIAEELGYRPDAIARSLVQRDTMIIGLVIVRFTNPFYARMIKDFTRQLQNRGYSTLLFNVEDSQEMEERLPTALQYRVDGVIITSAMLSSKMAAEYAKTGTPIVLFNRYTLEGNVNAVCCDNTEGGRLAAQTLLEDGHERLAYIAGEQGSSTNRDRKQGFEEVLGQHGYLLQWCEQGDYSYESGYAAARRLLQNDQRPDAIFCANDLMAMGALDVARHEFNLKVPGDLSIIGFDDIPMAQWPCYSLTTIRQPFKPMVDTTIEVLMNAIQSPDGEADMRWVTPELIRRRTTRGGKV
jgi:DNA-binding LacI/PurR family transcriptional regulator